MEITINIFYKETKTEDIKKLLENNENLKIRFSNNEVFFKKPYQLSEWLFIVYIESDKNNNLLLSDFPNSNLDKNNDSGEDIIFLSSKEPFLNIREVKSVIEIPDDLKNKLKEKIRSSLKESFGGEWNPPKKNNTKIGSVEKLKPKTKTSTEQCLIKVKNFEKENGLNNDHFFNEISNYLDSIKKNGEYKDGIAQTFILFPASDKLIKDFKEHCVDLDKDKYTFPKNATHKVFIWQLKDFDNEIKIDFHQNKQKNDK